MTRHERMTAARVVPEYEIDTLGAPFKVSVLDCVTLKVDAATGKEFVNVPDLCGLINAVVRARAIHPRKFNGAEIKFSRNALGIKANALADFLEMSPEHISRCEAGTKVMSAPSEKLFRLFTYLATYHPHPAELLRRHKEADSIGDQIEKKTKKADEVYKKFAEHFVMMEIQSVFDPDQELHFRFLRVDDAHHTIDVTDDESEGEWESVEPKLACCHR